MIKRIYQLDFIRSIAVLCIVLCHTVENTYFLDFDSLNKLDSSISLILHAVGRLGVPFFFFITGYLLLPRSFNDGKDIVKFYRHNLLGLLITTEIWIVLQNIFLSIFFQTHFSYNTLIKDMLFLENVKIPSMWYMPVIIGLYIFVPFISNILNKFGFKYIFFPVLCVYIYTSIIPSINILLANTNHTIVRPVLWLKNLGGIYGVYIILGYLFYKNIFKNMSHKLLVFLFIVMFLCSLSITFLTDYRIWYDLAPWIIASAALFLLLLRMKFSFMRKNIWVLVSKSAFGVYLIHFPILYILRYMVLSGISNVTVKHILLYLLTIIISFLIVQIISINNKMARCLFFYKK